MVTTYRMALAWAAVPLTMSAALEPSASELPEQEAIVIEGRVIEAETEAPPSQSVVVRYQEHGEDGHEPVLVDTGHAGEFRFEFREAGMGKFGLLSVREPGYNSALLVWRMPTDTDVVLRLSKPVAIYGTIVNASGLPVSGAMVKWSMKHDGRLASGAGTADENGSFRVIVPNKTNVPRIAAWAGHYAPTKVSFSYDDSDKPVTILHTLESVRDRESSPVRHGDDDRYLQDWINEILSSQEPSSR